MADGAREARAARLGAWLGLAAGWPAILAGVGLSALAALLPLLVFRGVYVSTMPHDSLSMADIGYRMAMGQVPGRDFHSAFGVLFQWQMQLGYLIGHTLSGTLKASAVLFTLAMVPFVAYLARTRLSNLGALVVCAAVMLTAAVPYAEAYSDNAGVTFAMLYNREGWVLLLLALLHWASPRRPAPVWADGLSLGLLIAGCVYFKISYGGLALLFCGLWAALQPRARPAAGIALTVLAIFAVLLEILYGFGFNFAYLADIRAAAQAGGNRLVHIAVNLIFARDELLVALVLVPLAAGRRVTAIALRDWVFILFCAAASLLVVWQNAQLEGLMALWAAVALVVETPLAEGGAGESVWRGLLIYAVWACLTLTPNLMALGEYALGSLTVRPLAPTLPMVADFRFATPREDKRIHGVGQVYGDEYAASLEDGVQLLAGCPRSASVITLDLFEPFTLVDRRIPNHAWTWQHFGHSFSEKVHLLPETEFRGVDCVMVPHHPLEPGSAKGLLLVYGPYLKSHFTVARSSDDWDMWRRTAP